MTKTKNIPELPKPSVEDYNVIVDDKKLPVETKQLAAEVRDLRLWTAQTFQLLKETYGTDDNLEYLKNRLSMLQKELATTRLELQKVQETIKEIHD